MDGGGADTDRRDTRTAPDAVRRRLATWLIQERRAIDSAFGAGGGNAPAPDSPEAEVLRRFRSFLTTGLTRGTDSDPPLEGLRVREGRTQPLLRGWLEAAATCAGPDADDVRERLEPLLERFTLALRATAPARRRSGAPQSSRRAVPAAIDRVAEAFLAIDTETGLIVDANPAAGALLATTRDALVGSELAAHVPGGEDDPLFTEIDAAAEGAEGRRFLASLSDPAGRRLLVEASLTSWTTRRRTLALLMVRAAELGIAQHPSGPSPAEGDPRPDASPGTEPAATTRLSPAPAGTSPRGSRS